MKTIRILGIVIILVLIFSLLAAANHMIAGPQGKEKTISNNYTLNDAQIAGINRVNINFQGNTSGIGVKFQNKSENLYDISIEREENSREPSVTYTRNGDVLDVNLLLDSGSASIALGNRCTYNTNLQTKVGGFGLYLDNNGKLDNVNTSIKYVGGGTVVLGNSTFNRMDLSVNLGGFAVQVLPEKFSSTGTIHTNIQIGGVNLQIQPASNLGYQVKGTVDLGGLIFEPNNFNVLVNNTTNTVIESKDYSKKSSKLQIESTVGLGGVNINMFYMPLEMFPQ
ncbi:MAG: hypothetical protein HVN35_07320 [Methanobacteriaceae archaeon]|nr:hypothetical protein [Methanobacteriaceae archaeon]